MKVFDIEKKIYDELNGFLPFSELKVMGGVADLSDKPKEWLQVKRVGGIATFSRVIYKEGLELIAGAGTDFKAQDILTEALAHLDLRADHYHSFTDGTPIYGLEVLSTPYIDSHNENGGYNVSMAKVEITLRME